VKRETSGEKKTLWNQQRQYSGEGEKNTHGSNGGFLNEVKGES